MDVYLLLDASCNSITLTFFRLTKISLTSNRKDVNLRFANSIRSHLSDFPFHQMDYVRKPTIVVNQSRPTDTKSFIHLLVAQAYCYCTHIFLIHKQINDHLYYILRIAVAKRFNLNRNRVLRSFVVLLEEKT